MGCNDVSMNLAGTPMTEDALVAYIDVGLIMPMSVTYEVTDSTLVLDAHDDGKQSGIAKGGGTTLTRSR
jgi:hypothetical protein